MMKVKAVSGTKRLLFFVIFGMLLVLQLASARGSMASGYRIFDINRTIVNIAEYPDYVFFSYGGYGFGICPITIISEDGQIPTFCVHGSPLIYAIKKSDFNESEVRKNEENIYYTTRNVSKVEEYLFSVGAKKVIGDLGEGYKEVPIGSSEESVNLEYVVKLGTVVDKPSKEIKERNFLFYTYPLMSIAAILMIALTLTRRKRNGN